MLYDTTSQIANLILQCFELGSCLRLFALAERCAERRSHVCRQLQGLKCQSEPLANLRNPINTKSPSQQYKLTLPFCSGTVMTVSFSPGRALTTFVSSAIGEPLSEIKLKINGKVEQQRPIQHSYSRFTGKPPKKKIADLSPRLGWRRKGVFGSRGSKAGVACVHWAGKVPEYEPLASRLHYPSTLLSLLT